MRKNIAALFLISIIFTMGCVTFDEEPSGITCIDPEKLIDNRCCFDEDNNGVCDIDEMVCPETCDDSDDCTNDHCSLQTKFKCENDAIIPCCGNGICEDPEDVANECPEDCDVIQMTDFYHRLGGPDYMDGDKFVFIHTGSNETDKSPDFSVNITATVKDLVNIRTTYNCTDSATGNVIDSINVDMIEVVEGYPTFGHENEFENDEYTMYTSFYSEELKTRIDVDELEIGKTVEFRVRITKQDYKVRSDLICDFDFYFLEPLKHVKKELKISYI
ncbi:MAG: hypothetical protein KAS04_04315 [Candidatus Aenigmarchaeota archaeon]|nr:hypothetical protein [Candidatus Aenigmarchaeota archaeon]